MYFSDWSVNPGIAEERCNEGEQVFGGSVEAIEEGDEEKAKHEAKTQSHENTIR